MVYKDILFTQAEFIKKSLIQLFKTIARNFQESINMRLKTSSLDSKDPCLIQVCCEVVLHNITCYLCFVEQDKMDGCGTGKLHGRQLFVCRKDFALFVPIETVIPEEVFDENPVNARGSSLRTSERVDNVEEQIHQDERLAKSLSCDAYASSSGKFQFNTGTMGNVGLTTQAATS